MPPDSRALTAIALLAFSGCGGPDLDFKQAAHLEAKGEVLRAAAAYDAFLEKHPADARVPEVAYKAGRLYAEVLGRCSEAVARFETAARAGGEWAEPARLGLVNCPDYFPLREGGKWVYGDTQTGGTLMRLEVKVDSAEQGHKTRLSGVFFAGTERLPDSDYKGILSKEGWSVWEFTKGSRNPILRYPYKTGNAWTHGEGAEMVSYRIVADGVSVKTAAGAFEGCLKVKSQKAGFESWVFDYFCPGVGRVKNTIGVPGIENPNTELIAYTVR